MKFVRFKDEANRLNVRVDDVRKILVKSVSEDERFHGIIDVKSEGIIYYEPEEMNTLAKRLSSERVSIQVLANELNLRRDQMRLIINKLLNEDKVKGSIVEKPIPMFIPDSITRRESEDYEKAIERLTTLFSKGEISEQSYKTAVKSLEKKLGGLMKEKKKIPETLMSKEVIPESKKPVKEEKHVERRLTTSQIIALMIILMVGGGIWWWLSGTQTPTQQEIKFNIFDVEGLEAWDSRFEYWYTYGFSFKLQVLGGDVHDVTVHSPDVLDRPKYFAELKDGEVKSITFAGGGIIGSGTKTVRISTGETETREYKIDLTNAPAQRRI